ncbi:response regulator [Planctomycetota bacterium]
MKRIRVLLIDDEEELVSALAERLMLRDIEAVGVTRGAEGLRWLEKEQFDVIILDLKMPDMSGMEVMRRVGKLAPEVPVILFTGHGSVKSSEEGLEQGAFAYLAKPIRIEELVATIKEAAAG